MVSDGESSWRVEKAGRFMLAAQRAFEAGDWETAVSRAYYAIFQLVTAALERNSEVLRVPKTHSQLHGLLRSQRGLALNIFDTRQARAFQILFLRRQAADYREDGPDSNIAAESLVTAQRLHARLVEVLRG